MYHIPAVLVSFWRLATATPLPAPAAISCKAPLSGDARFDPTLLHAAVVAPSMFFDDDDDDDDDVVEGRLVFGAKKLVNEDWGMVGTKLMKQQNEFAGLLHPVEPPLRVPTSQLNQFAEATRAKSAKFEIFPRNGTNNDSPARSSGSMMEALRALIARDCCQMKRLNVPEH